MNNFESLNNNNINIRDFSLKDIPACYGRNKYSKVKLYKTYFIKKNKTYCNDCFLEKDKIKFIKQLFNWFYKSPIVFDMQFYLQNKKKCILKDGDFIRLFCKLNFSSLKKMWSIFNLRVIDKKRFKANYSVCFCFYFNNLKESTSNISLDISSNENGIIVVMIILNSFYNKEIMQLLFYYYNDLKKLIYN